MFIPWYITITTRLSQDEVLLKLKNMTDQNADIAFGPDKSEINENAGISKTFGGTVDYISHTFRLLYAPYSILTFMRDRFGTKTIYQGSVEYEDGECRIGTWVRPSFGSLIIVILWAIATFRVLLNLKAYGNLVTLASLGVAYAYMFWNTYKEVGKAKGIWGKIFESK
jgi:hypothetical protein